MEQGIRAAFAGLVLAIALSACGGGEVTAEAGAKAVERVCSQSSDARLKAMSDTGIGRTSTLGLAAGRYALPAGKAPTQLVVMFHGSHNDSCSWRNHLRDAAARGAIAVAMDYSGQHDQDGIENYGWYVREGAADSIAAARYFLEKYPTLATVTAFGVSMGGNTSGIALLSPDAVRLDGTTPLFDYWVDIEGVNNLAEEYLVIRGVAQTGNEAAVVAQQEIEEENGGAIEDVPEAYQEISTVTRADELAYLKGAVVVNGLDDGLVTTDQSPQMAAALNAAMVPTHLYTVFLNGGAESGSTASSIVLGNVDPTYESPLAGHGWEGSDTSLVMNTGVEALHAILDGEAPGADYTFVTGSAAGSIP